MLDTPIYLSTLLLPLVAFILVGLFGKTLGERVSQWISVGVVAITAVLSTVIFYDVAILGNEYKEVVYTWIKSGQFSADIKLQFDVLTAVMMIVVSWVSTAVHLYAVGYMKGDKNVSRFMSFLLFFTFSMFLLVSSGNLLQSFLGWEGVGFASYLLIGFYTKKATANTASMKAFIMNRVADMGFLLGIFTIYQIFGTLDFDAIFATRELHIRDGLYFFGYGFNGITLACAFLFFGAMGKSAQFGLHSWLPDAMEGPTPVSALLHSATMVSAGVFLIVRCSPLFENAYYVSAAITVVGALSCIYGAIVATKSNDIKKVIAYSTISQLGYMFLACGLGAYSVAIFHLFTHAFFKALLFVSAGSVIHAMSGKQDMREMGGLWKKIPYTYAAIWIGSIAIAGIPPLSGFFSKDLILETAFASSSTLTGGMGYIMGTFGVIMSAFYSWRLIFLTFHGKPRASADVVAHVHESPAIMLIPMGFLSIMAAVAGWIGYTKFHMPSIEFWNGSIFILAGNTVLQKAHHTPALVKYIPLVLTGLGIIFAYYIVIKKKDKISLFKGVNANRPDKLYEKASRFVFKAGDFFFAIERGLNKIYDSFITMSFILFGRHLWKIWDNIIIDGSISKGLSGLSLKAANRVSAIQSGYVFHYAFVMILGIIVLMGWGLFSILF